MFNFMSMKYEILKDNFKINSQGVKVFRIRHKKTKEMGGWIEKKKNLSQFGTCWVGGEAEVFGNASVFGNAQVLDNAIVFGRSMVGDDAELFGHAIARDLRVGCKSRMSGDPKTTKIFGLEKLDEEPDWVGL